MRFQSSPSWLTPWGVAMKRRMLEAKGLPDMKGCRFVTLSLDPALFDYDPLAGYLAGKDKLRRFLDGCRKCGIVEAKEWWAWKLEFQRNGWAHWHLVMERKRKFSLRELNRIGELWGYGRTNVRRITKGRFGYQFKYAFKGVYQDDAEGERLCVPRWFLDYYAPGVDGGKPCSFARVRFWQTSQGFYTGASVPAPEACEAQSSILPRPLSEVIEDRARGLVVIARDRFGNYVKGKSLHLGVSRHQFFRVHHWDSENGAGCTLGTRSYALDPVSLTKLIERNEKWQLNQILRENHLTLRRALRFRAEGQSLMTC